ncbi:MAG: sigma-70 family RNA polymerase sigma factor [Kiritimatiellae bacterium]|nr:sigma-70 family RNA polymerase sigma factor [Kiritimatiellia bacterium]
MASIPATSTTLLRDLANDSQHARWAEFVTRYRPMMEAFMRERFPSLDADDVIQETLIAVCTALPSYRYVPEEKGYFHNYLTGILRNKALRQLHKEQRQAEIADEMRRSRGDAPQCMANGGRARSPSVSQGVIQGDDEQSWRVTLVEIALQQLMSDESIQSRTRQVFLRVVVNGEKPEAVAAAFGITCNGVYLIKNRMMPRLQKIVAALEKAGNI